MSIGNRYDRLFIFCLCANNIITYSQAMHSVQMRTGVKFGDVKMVDTMLKDGLTDAFHGYHMGVTGKYCL